MHSIVTNISNCAQTCPRISLAYLSFIIALHLIDAYVHRVGAKRAAFLILSLSISCKTWLAINVSTAL